MQPTTNQNDMGMQVLIKDDLRPYMGNGVDIKNGFLYFNYMPDDRSPDRIWNQSVDFDKGLLVFEERESGTGKVTNKEFSLSPEELSKFKDLVEAYDKVPNKPPANSLDFITYTRYQDGKVLYIITYDRVSLEFRALISYISEVLAQLKKE
jgi:hypothetical protein